MGSGCVRWCCEDCVPLPRRNPHPTPSPPPHPPILQSVRTGLYQCTRAAGDPCGCPSKAVLKKRRAEWEGNGTWREALLSGAGKALPPILLEEDHVELMDGVGDENPDGGAVVAVEEEA